jgi:hypothetical protein
LGSIVREAEREKERQLREVEAVERERAQLGDQLVARSEELAALYEKLKLQRSGLLHGYDAYEERLAERLSVQTEIRALDREAEELEGETGRRGALRREAQRLHREVQHEQLKLRTFRDEQSRPINVHRWRRMEDEDPAKYALICEVHALQSRGIAVRDEIHAIEGRIEDKERLYVKLQEVMRREPVEEVEEERRVLVETLREKKGHMKEVEKGLRVSVNQVEGYKGDIVKARAEVAKINKHWIKERGKQ